VPRSVFLVANPAAGHGRAAKLLPAVRRAFAGIGAPKPLVTRGPGDEARCVWEALDAGADTIAILGGDGTLSKATGALLAARAGDRCRVLMLPGGSGNDFISTLAMRSRAWVEMAKLAVDGVATPVDCARIDGRHVLNVGGFGFDVAALRTLQRLGALGRLAGNALRYKLAAAKHIFGFRPLRADLDDGLGERELLLVAIANGRRYGGGILVAPNASVDDGMLDVVSIEDAPATERIALFQTAQTGAHIARDGVAVRREARVTLRFDAPPAFQIDGELHQSKRSEIVAESVPGALRVITGPAVATPAIPGLPRSAASSAAASRSTGRP